MSHRDEVKEYLRFGELVRIAIADFEEARDRGDGKAMAEAATRWELAENCVNSN
jgi:hypothetical protein